MQQIRITYSLMKFLFASDLTWSSLAFHDWRQWTRRKR